MALPPCETGEVPVSGELLVGEESSSVSLTRRTRPSDDFTERVISVDDDDDDDDAEDDDAEDQADDEEATRFDMISDLPERSGPVIVSLIMVKASLPR